MEDKHEIPLENKRIKLINPLILGREKCCRSHFFGPAVRDYWLLHYVVSGKGIIKVGNSEETVTAGKCFIIRPYERTYYEADAENPWEYIWIGFTSELEMPSQLTDKNVAEIPGMGAFFADLMSCEELPYKEEYLSGRLWELLCIMRSLAEKSHDRRDAMTAKVKNYIESEYMKDISISVIADKLHLNRSYMSTEFRKSLGVSPQQYLCNYRLNRALYFMQNLGFTPSEAAQAAGYSDIFSFSRMFKRHFGLSPVNYLKKNNESL